MCWRHRFPHSSTLRRFSTPDINWLYPVIIERRSFLLNLCCKQFVKTSYSGYVEANHTYCLTISISIVSCRQKEFCFGSGLVSTTPRPSAMVRYLSRRHSPTLDTMFQHRDRERHTRWYANPISMSETG